MGNIGNDYETFEMTAVRGGAIGLISGLKGGAVSGALGGALLMLGTTAATGEWSIILFSLILGLTTGLMAGVFIGGVSGIAAGALSGWLLATRPNGDPRRVWLPLAAFVTAGVGGWFYREPPVLGLLLGAGLGLLAGWISARDFAAVSARQRQPAEAEEQG